MCAVSLSFSKETGVILMESCGEPSYSLALTFHRRYMFFRQ